ncbi:MAG: hypothetical protein J1E60_04380 [Christensenellaceae bacterium]|nr:hypothetical protein [Christensenellaceae bacterium]
MELDITMAREFIAGKFKNQGDFDFMNEEELNGLINLLLGIDAIYLEEIGEDGVYDEDVVYERMLKAASTGYSRYKTYLMRFIDDYMDFMEQYLVSIDAVEWE